MWNFKSIKVWKLAARLMAILVVLGSCSCAQIGNGDSRNRLIEVWTKPEWPPTNAAAPEGFKVTPAEAYQIAARSRRLSLKHVWICFRDSRHYYIADAFGKAETAKTALKHGLKVNGNTGSIE